MAAMKKDFSVEGDLEDYPFPSLLQVLHEKGATGRLVIRRGEITKVIFMVEGRPVNVDSTLRDETLGRFLIKKGKITEDDYEQSVNLMIEQNIQQGAALVTLGVMSPRALYHEVKAQNREKLVTCFAWTSGNFGFYPEVDFVEDMYRFEMAMPPVMHEGIRRFFPPVTVEMQLAKVRSGPIVPSPDFKQKVVEYELGDQEYEFIFHIDGKRDLLALKKGGESIPGSAKLLYLLLVCGLIGPNGSPEIALRGLALEIPLLPPIEDFMMTGSEDTAPEVIEEEFTASEFEPDYEGHEEAGGGRYNEDEVFDNVDFGTAHEKTRLDIEEEDREDEDMDTSPPPIGGEAAGGEEETQTHPRKEESDILELYMNIKSADFFSLLRISQDADDDEVIEAYRRLRSEYDKNRIKAGLSAEAQDKLEEINTRIIRAYETLRTKQGRWEYQQRIEREGEDKRLKPALKAEQCLQKGLLHVRKREWPQAQEMFELAVSANPEEPEYLGYLGWTIYSNPDLDLTERREKAKQLIATAMEINPNMDSAPVFLGKIFKDEGNVPEAVRMFKNALQCNPKCREAERELKSHEQGEW